MSRLHTVRASVADVAETFGADPVRHRCGISLPATLVLLRLPNCPRVFDRAFGEEFAHLRLRHLPPFQEVRLKSSWTVPVLPVALSVTSRSRPKVTLKAETGCSLPALRCGPDAFQRS